MIRTVKVTLEGSDLEIRETLKIWQDSGLKVEGESCLCKEPVTNNGYYCRGCHLPIYILK